MKASISVTKKNITYSYSEYIASHALTSVELKEQTHV